MFGGLHAHFDRVEWMADAEFCYTREYTSYEATIVLRGCRLGWLPLSNSFIAALGSVWVCNRATVKSVGASGFSRVYAAYLSIVADITHHTRPARLLNYSPASVTSRKPEMESSQLDK